MKGDIAFAGFMLTAEEWRLLDADDRAQLIAVATRRVAPEGERPRRFPDGTGKHEIIDFELDSTDLIDLADDEPDSNLEPPSSSRPDDSAVLVSATEPGVHDSAALVPATEAGVDGGWEDFADLNEI